MTQIGELAYKVKFDGSALTRGMLSTREQFREMRKIVEASQSPMEKYQVGMRNIEALVARFPQVARQKIELEKQLERQYLSEESAIRKLTRAENERLKGLGGNLNQKKDTTKSSGMEMAAMAGMAGRFMGPAAAIGTAVKSIGKFVEVENAAAAFDVLTGSAAESVVMMSQIRDLTKSGLGFGAMANSAQTMLGFGVATQNVIPMVRAFGDISGGNAERMKSLALAFGQTTAAGRLMGQEVLQMINAGFNPLAEISRTTGRSMADLKKDMEDGKVSVEMVSNAFISATSEGGRFHGMLEKKMETTGGAITQMTNKLDNMMISLGEKMSPIVRDLTDLFNDLEPAISQVVFLVQKMVDGFRFLHALGKDASLKGLLETVQGNRSPFSHSGKVLDEIEARRQVAASPPPKPAPEPVAPKSGPLLSPWWAEQGKAMGNMLTNVFEKMQQKSNELTERGNSLRDKHRDPAEIMRKELQDLGELLKFGAIDERTFGRESGAIKNRFMDETIARSKLTQADVPALSATLVSGSQEAYQHVARMRSGKTEAKNPQLEELKKQAERQFEEARKQTVALEKLAETGPKRIR